MLADMCSGISAACHGSSGVLCSFACIPQTVLLISLGFVWAEKMQCPHSNGQFSRVHWTVLTCPLAIVKVFIRTRNGTRQQVLQGFTYASYWLCH